MQTAKTLACCLLLFPLLGAVRWSVPAVRAKSLTHLNDSSKRIALLAKLRTGGEEFRAGRYQQPATRFKSLAAIAAASHDLYVEARAADNAGGCLCASTDINVDRIADLDEPAIRAFCPAPSTATCARQARTNPVQALRAAQLEMMHSGDWRSHPRYWAAYFTVGIEGMR